MIAGKSVLAVVTARGGSKRVPRKNVREAAGKPLIAWTFEAARASAYVDRLVLSSDDEEAIAVAARWGVEVPFVRPESLAADDTPGVSPVLHALAALPGYDYVVLLQPTSPLRATVDLDGAIRRCVEAGAGACVSMTSPDKSPYWMYYVGQDGRMQPLVDPALRRELPLGVLNGAVYVARSDWLVTHETFVTDETVAYMMPRSRSLDIDTEADFHLFEILAKESLHDDL
jgi:N-acylneuraminate cytidylyltransferase